MERSRSRRNPRSIIRGVYVYCGDDPATESGPFRDEDDAQWHRRLFDACGHDDLGTLDCGPHEVAWNDDPADA